MMRELRALGLDLDPKFILEADQAVKYAQEVSSAAILKDGRMWAWKDIAGSLVGDIDTPQHLLNAINRYLPEGVPKFGRLGDVPPQVAVDALQGRAAVKAGGEAAGAAHAASDALMETPAYRADAILANLTGFEAVPGGGQHVSSMAGRGFASADEADEVARVLTEQGFQPERFVTEGGQEGVRVRVPAKDVDAAKAAANARIEASVAAEQGAAKAAPATATLRPVVPPYSQGSAPSGARVFYNQLPDINELFGRTLTSIDAAGDRVIPMIGNPELDSALTLWEKEGVAGVAEARLVANKVGIAERDFALHNYAERYGFDHALAYIYPYQFWYTRTYAKWLQRIAASPGIVANYARYKDALGKMHADLPEHWRYSINTDELLGIQTDHPLFFNLEATLNPINGLTGVDYYDTKKRVNWWTSTLDNLGKFGPNIWTPISLATAVALYNKDQEASARWAGRLFPQTATLRPVLSAIAGKPVEVDPWVLLFSGGIDPTERSRVGRALGAMVNENPAMEEAAIEAARVQENNPLWQQAQMRAMNERFPGQLASFIFGAGFRMRTQSDITIDQFWSDYNLMWTKWPDMSPQKKVDTMDWMRREYPFMDTILLSRKTGVERDTTYAYNVMARIPPGKSDDYMEYVGADRDYSSRFYEDGGDISKWSETDRMRFMAAIVDIGAMLNLPQDATKQKWNAAKVESDKMYSAMEGAFGADIMDRVSAYWTLQDENPTEARKMLAADPAIGQAQDYREQYIMSNKVLVGYYGTLSTVENYWKGYMKEQAEKEFGEGTLLEVAEYESIIDPVAKKEYKKEHPRVKQYYDLRDEWNPWVAARIVEFGAKLGEGEPVLSGAEPTSSGQEQFMAEMEEGQGLPEITWAEWQDVLGESLSNLVADYALYGEPIPEQGISRIGAFGRDMGAPSNDIAVEMAAWAVLQAEQGGQ
jgi:hypothetical protein